jgi:amino acid permease
MLNLPQSAYDTSIFSGRFHLAASEVVYGAKYWVRSQGEALGIPPAVQDVGLLLILALIVFYLTKAMSRFARFVVIFVVTVIVVYGIMMPGGWL